MAYNRELSQLAPFIYVDEYLRNIGIGTTGLPHVGMGTTVPIGKLDVRGHSHFTNVAVSTGATIANLSVTGVTTTFNFEATGISSFVGFTTFRDNIIVAGLSTFAGLVTTFNDVYVGLDLYVDDNIHAQNQELTQNFFSSNASGISTFVGVVSFRNNVKFLDNNILSFGTEDDDLQIFHDGTNSIIRENGSGSLVIAGTGETTAVFTDDGSVELYFDDSRKLETVGLGVTIYGTLFTDQLSVAGVSTFIGVTTFSDSDVFISNSLYVNQLNVTGGITTLGDDITTRNLEVTGFSTFHGEMNALGNVGLGTTNPLNTLQVGLGNSSLTVVSTASTIMVGVGTTNPQRTFDMKGDGNVEGSFNVDGSLSVNQSAVATIGLVIALGG